MAYLHHLFLLALVLVPLFAFYECHANPVDTTSIQLNDDVLGLIVFKSDLHDPQNKLSSWNEDANSPCSWSFILCNPSNGRVSEISMEGLSLSGKLGRGLKELQFLKVLSLSHNNLTGNIGDVLTQLPARLEKLNLSHNKFSGQISSSMVSLNGIKILDLSENLLTGSLPESVFGGSSLHYLSLAGNSLEGSLPSTLAKCSALNGLNLANNRLSGNPFVSGGIWSLSRIRVLDLSNNEFSGPVPVGILALHNMKELHLQSNQFSGSIPSDIGYCPHLSQVDLSKNQFNGEVPGSLRMLTSLTLLDLSSNMLTGEFPQWIGNMTSLESIDFSENSLTGSLPMSISNLRSLQNLVLSRNNLSGIIPDSLASCSQLSIIRIRENALNGIIPQSLFSMGLQQLDLSWNKLTGSIPPGSSRLFDTLLAMDLSGNQLTGNIPPEMGLFTNLGFLNFSYNILHSRIPPELGYLQKLQVLDLRSNAFYESIPGDICESRSLSILQLDQNYLSGPIPTAIANCSSLYLLSLSHNNLSGMIPRTMMMLKKLEILKLEFNQLTGEIPPELSTLQNLLEVNVSYNRLVGRLPQRGIFPSLDQTSLEGNLGICSPLLKGPCMMNVPKPLVIDPKQMHGHGGGAGRGEGDGYESPAKFNNHTFLSLSVIISMAAALMIIIGVVVITLLNASTRRRLVILNTKATESMFSSSPKSLGGSPSMGRLILFDSRSPGGEWITNPESLFTKATDIGGGGTVYKTRLEAIGREVAIKRLPQTNIVQHPQDFDREVRLLGRVRHPNLVSLRGYYWTPQLQLLVSDYISNASLQSILHDRRPTLPPVSWGTRFKIMLGTAKALSHLHHSCNPPIIHYNLKPSNILLDESYNVKVSDFGLLRLLAKADRNIISNRFQSALGYMAPELTCQSLRINEKCDVYGYGVMVLELVTGRRPMEYGEDNIVILNDHVRVLLEQGNMLDCIDESMGEYPEEEVLPVLKLALVCTSQIPSSRPSMAEVVQILQVIKTPVPPRTNLY